jgi:hypothetical protein
MATKLFDTSNATSFGHRSSNRNLIVLDSVSQESLLESMQVQTLPYTSTDTMLESNGVDASMLLGHQEHSTVIKSDTSDSTPAAGKTLTLDSIASGKDFIDAKRVLVAELQ